MLGLFKSDPVKKLKKQYNSMMEEAMHVQRSGDLKLYAKKMKNAEKMAAEIEALSKK